MISAIMNKKEVMKQSRRKKKITQANSDNTSIDCIVSPSIQNDFNDDCEQYQNLKTSERKSKENMYEYYI